MPFNYKAMIQPFLRAGTDKNRPPDRDQLDQAKEWVTEAFKEKIATPQDVELGKLFAECYGWSSFVDCRNGEWCWNVMEAAGATSTAAFVHISGNILISAIRGGFEDEEFVFSKIIPDEQSNIIGMERMADIVPIGDEMLVVKEGDAFPKVGPAEDWFFLPEARKRGGIVALTREAIFQVGANGDLIRKCEMIGESLGISKENRLIDCVIDENGGAVSTPIGHRYCRQGNYISTYGNNSGNHNFDNLEASNALLDWSDVDAAEQLLNAMTHPGNGEPIVLKGLHLVVAKQNEKVARRIAGADVIKVATPGWATSGNPTETTVGNPYANSFEVVTSRRVASRLATDTDWFYGDLRAAFGYKTIFPFQVLQAPPNSYDEFHHDIVRQWRADEMGAAFTKEPRAMTKCTVA